MYNEYFYKQRSKEFPWDTPPAAPLQLVLYASKPQTWLDLFNSLDPISLNFLVFSLFLSLPFLHLYTTRILRLQCYAGDSQIFLPKCLCRLIIKGIINNILYVYTGGQSHLHALTSQSSYIILHQHKFVDLSANRFFYVFYLFL